MKKLLYNITIFFLFILTSFAGERVFIGTALNTTKNKEAESFLRLDENTQTGDILFGEGLFGAGDFKYTQNNNKIYFTCRGISYEVTISRDGAVGKYTVYDQQNGNQNGKLKYIELTPKNVNNNIELFYKIMIESMLNEDQETLQNFLKNKLHLEGKAISFKIENFGFIGYQKNGAFSGVNMICVLTWKDSTQIKKTKFACSYDQVSRNFSAIKLLETTSNE